MARNIGQFELVEQISAGSVGAVWRAIQTTLDRPVALKELHPALAQDPTFIERFEREAKAAASLDHENIVRVIDFGRDGDSDVYFLAMEFVDGLNLDDILADSGRLPPSVTYTIACDILAALAHAHEHGVVHRDVKPGNIMLNAKGVAKLADFSIAKARKMPSITTGESPGSPFYMSPEQFTNHPIIDGRSDLFSLGVVLYQCFTGKLPFNGSDKRELQNEVLRSTPNPPRAVVPWLPTRMSQVILRCLAKDARARFINAAECLDEFKKAAFEAGLIENRVGAARIVREPAAANSMAQVEANELIQLRVQQAEQQQQQKIENTATLSRRVPNEARRPIWMYVAFGAVWLAALLVVAFFVWRMINSGKQVVNDPSPVPTASQVVVESTAEPSPTTTPPVRKTGLQPTPRRTQLARVTATPVPVGREKSMLTVSSPTTVALYIDGRSKGMLEGTRKFEVLAGNHVVIFKHPNAQTVTRRITIQAGKEETVSIGTLNTSGAAGRLRLSIPSNPRATIYIDGFEVAQTPIKAALVVQAGERIVEISNPKCQPYRRRVAIESQRTTTLKIDKQWCTPK